MKPENTLFVPGLWFNPEGPLSEKISKHATVLNVLGMNTLEERVEAVTSHIKNHPNIKNLVGHSAGAYVVAAVIKSGKLSPNIRNVVLLNSAPLPGIKFSIFDRVFWAMMKYLLTLFFGKKIGLTRRDSKKLLSLSEEDLDDLGDSLVPESAEFTRHIVANQFASRWQCVHPRASVRLTIVSATDDDMVGGTWRETEEVLSPVWMSVQIKGGHMHALREFENIVGLALHGPYCT